VSTIANIHQEDTMIPREITQMKTQLVQDIAVLIGQEFNLRDYEISDLANALNQTNFHEFWFSGRPSGSYKVYVNPNRVPYVYDQNQLKQNKSRVYQLNSVLVQLIKAYNDSFRALAAEAVER
jgi:hypothetical protein